MSEYITIVSGLPRTGTSMMMKMLEAGGMGVVVDGIRQADIDNPGGYYELEAAKKIKEDASWLESARGKVFKMVSLLLRELPAGMRYRVIFMERAMPEVLASQEKMLKRLGKETSGNPEQMARLYEEHLIEIKDWLGRQQNIGVLYVSYNQVMEVPHETAEAVNRFLGGGLDVDKMAGVIDEGLYRNRAAAQRSLDEKVAMALDVIRGQLDRKERTAVAFGGGKDSVVLLHLVRAATPGGLALPVLCMDPDSGYNALYYFIEKMRKLWTLDILRIKTPSAPVAAPRCPELYPGMAELIAAASGLGFSRLLTGIRADEQGVSINAGELSECGPVTLVNPLLGFTERDVWNYVKAHGLPWCSLYSGGAGKLGCLPGSALLISTGVRPLEANKGQVKESLRALGYL